MSAINTDGLPILEAPHVFPDDLVVSETRPAVATALCQEVIETSAHWGPEEGLPGHRVVVGRDRGRQTLSLRLFGLTLKDVIPSDGRGEGEAEPLLCIVAFEAGNAVGCVAVDTILQLLLHFRDAGAELFLTFEGLASDDWEGAIEFLDLRYRLDGDVGLWVHPGGGDIDCGVAGLSRGEPSCHAQIEWVQVALEQRVETPS